MKSKFYKIFFVCLIILTFVRFDDVYAAEKKSCQYKDELGKTYLGKPYVVEQYTDGSVKVYDPKGKEHDAFVYGDLNAGCPKYLHEYLTTGNNQLHYNLNDSEYTMGMQHKLFVFEKELSTEDENSTVNNDNSNNNNNNNNVVIKDVQCPELLVPVINFLKKFILPILQIGVPIFLIIVGMLDFGKGVMASKEDEMKKGQKAFIRRLLAAVSFFFVTTIVTIFMNLMANINIEGAALWRECWGYEPPTVQSVCSEFYSDKEAYKACLEKNENTDPKKICEQECNNRCTNDEICKKECIKNCS